MTNNPFAMPDPADQGGFLLTPAGVLALAAGAIHDDDAGAEGKARAARLIRAVLDAAATNGCCRTEVLETLLCDYGIGSFLGLCSAGSFSRALALVAVLGKW